MKQLWESKVSEELSMATSSYYNKLMREDGEEDRQLPQHLIIINDGSDEVVMCKTKESARKKINKTLHLLFSILEDDETDKAAYERDLKSANKWIDSVKL